MVTVPVLPFRLVIGDPDAEFYAAYVAMNRRVRPGVHFELALGHPWRWTGAGGPIEASLVDVLAAVNYARIARLPGRWPIDMSAIHAAHEHALHAALSAGDQALFERLHHEQAAVADLVDEGEATRRLGHRLPTSLSDLRLWYRSICPPALLTGDKRTKWFWSRTQFDEWRRRRPGKGWRRGQALPRRECPDCHRQRVAATIDLDALQVRLRPHKRDDNGDWCATTVTPLSLEEARAQRDEATAATA